MKEIILSHKAEKEKLIEKKSIPRELDIDFTSESNKLIRVIIGPRRAGKSTFAIQKLKEKKFAYVNFDDERLAGTSHGDQIIQSIKEVYGKTPYLLFDEIQNMPRWELFVNRLQRLDYHLIITGSNSQLLSSELATHLTGRYIEYQILPFSFREYLTVKGFTTDPSLSPPETRGTLLNYLDQYLKEGGYPEIVVNQLDLRSYLKTLFESILFKDIVKRYGVRFAKKLGDLGHFLLTNHANEFSYTGLKKLLDFRSVHTIENYIHYLEQAYLTFLVNRFSFSLKSQIKSPKKTYAYDTGMVNAVKFGISPDAGRFLENAVAIELKRRRDEFYYYQTDDNKKVDFALRKGTVIHRLIQVCYDLTHEKTKQRELKALARASDELECRDLLVLTWTHKGEEKFKGHHITYQPVWEWILEKGGDLMG